MMIEQADGNTARMTTRLVLFIILNASLVNAEACACIFQEIASFSNKDNEHFLSNEPPGSYQSSMSSPSGLFGTEVYLLMTVFGRHFTATVSEFVGFVFSTLSDKSIGSTGATFWLRGVGEDLATREGLAYG
jgi:hypothetical protein